MLIGLRSLAQLPTTTTGVAEDDRARAIGNPLRRRQYLAGRALLRELLGHWPGVDPTTEIRARPGQAPTLPAWPSLRLSVSHSGPLVAAAVADQPVGIDVEEPRVGRDLSSLARWSMDAVEYAAWEPYGYGYLVIIDHGNGVRTYYAHNSRNLVRRGQTVKAGQLIARVGRTGMASGSHLHFEYRIDDQPVDPFLFVGSGELAAR